MESGKVGWPQELRVIAKNEGRDTELDLELKQGSHTGFCLDEKQKEQIYDSVDMYCTYYILMSLHTFH